MTVDLSGAGLASRRGYYLVSSPVRVGGSTAFVRKPKRNQGMVCMHTTLPAAAPVDTTPLAAHATGKPVGVQGASIGGIGSSESRATSFCYWQNIIP